MTAGLIYIYLPLLPRQTQRGEGEGFLNFFVCVFNITYKHKSLHFYYLINFSWFYYL